MIPISVFFFLPMLNKFRAIQNMVKECFTIELLMLFALLYYWCIFPCNFVHRKIFMLHSLLTQIHISLPESSSFISKKLNKSSSWFYYTKRKCNLKFYNILQKWKIQIDYFRIQIKKNINFYSSMLLKHWLGKIISPI